MSKVDVKVKIEDLMRNEFNMEVYQPYRWLLIPNYSPSESLIILVHNRAFADGGKMLNACA